MRTISVAAASTTAVRTSLFAGWGSIKPGTASVPGEALLCACSGQDAATGEQVIALLEAPAWPGTAVQAQADNCFARPTRGRHELNKWTHKAAAQLPLLALTVAAALHTVGLPTGRASIGTEANVPANVLIAGSSGRLPELLVQLVAARGARPYVAAHRDACDRLRSLGAAEVIDHDAISFSSAFGARRRPLDAVLDCVGVEGNADAIHAALGAAYVSLASPSLQRLEEGGALALIRSRWRKWRSSDDGLEGASIWRPDDVAGRALEEVIALIEQGELQPPPEANVALEMTEQFREFVSWARDTESGLRYGFPGESMWAEAADGEVPAPPERLWSTLGGDPLNLAYIDATTDDERGPSDRR